MSGILRAMVWGGVLVAATAAPLWAEGPLRPQPRPATLALPEGTAAPTPATAPRPRPAETPSLAAPKPAVQPDTAAAAAAATVTGTGAGTATATVGANAATATPPRDPNRGSVTNLPLPRYVSLKGNEGNARRGPGRTHRIDWVFTRAGMPLRITAEYEHWRRVEDAEGAGGWVHYALLSGVRSVLIASELADVHSRPEDGSAVEFRAERNVVGWVQECRPDWCRISINGERGWVRKSDLWGVEPGETIE